MFGFSIFLGEPIDESRRAYIQSMKQSGFNAIFSSVHIPEEQPDEMASRLKELGDIAHSEGLALVIDTSADALERLGIPWSKLKELIEWGVTGIRIDYGISNYEVALASQVIMVALNASTLTEEDIAELKQFEADFSNLEAWHNYYPRPETGLSASFLRSKNQWLKSMGLTTQAFVAGDGTKRGPIHEGLPTLESQRYAAPFASALELQQIYAVDKVFIGDPDLAVSSQVYFHKYIKEGVILLMAELFLEEFRSLKGSHTNRLDMAEYSLRSTEARLNNQKHIAAANTVNRSVGSITLDNEKYGRYMGELQIIRQELAADSRVNVIGQVTPSQRKLINLCGPGQKFEIRWEE